MIAERRVIAVAPTEELQMAALIVSNDLPVLTRVCDRIVMLYRGGVVFDGPPGDLEASPRPEVRQFASGSDSGPL